jgi:hypothetical protein
MPQTDRTSNRDICSDFVRGNCYRGEHCRYKHTRPVCRDFQAGRCTRGSSCSYTYEEQAALLSYGMATQLPMQRVSQIDNMNGLAGMGPVAGMSGGAGGKPECRDFQRGNCHRENCSFKHNFAAQASKPSVISAVVVGPVQQKRTEAGKSAADQLDEQSDNKRARQDDKGVTEKTEVKEQGKAE